MKDHKILGSVTISIEEFDFLRSLLSSANKFNAMKLEIEDFIKYPVLNRNTLLSSSEQLKPHLEMHVQEMHQLLEKYFL